MHSNYLLKQEINITTSTQKYPELLQIKTNQTSSPIPEADTTCCIEHSIPFNGPLNKDGDMQRDLCGSRAAHKCEGPT